MPDIIRLAPRVPASANSLAACAALSSPLEMLRAKLRRTASGLAPQFRAVLALAEPWYDWGKYCVVRVDDRGEGDVPHFEIDWLGIHLLIAIGRTPRATISDEEAFAWAR